MVNSSVSTFQTIFPPVRTFNARMAQSLTQLAGQARHGNFNVPASRIVLHAADSEVLTAGAQMNLL